METKNVREAWFQTMKEKEAYDPLDALFEADGDTWQLFNDDGPYVVWVSGKHFLNWCKRPVSFRTNPRSKKIYLQFQRPRLQGEKRMRVICVPAEAVREVYEEVSNG